MGSEGYLRTSLGGSGRVDSGSYSGSILVNSGPISEKPHGNLRNSLHLAVGRPLRLEYTKYGVLEGWWVVPRYSPPGPPTQHHPGYTPPHHGHHTTAARGQSRGVKVVVGLKSVAQLSLSAQISGFRGITEVYNLVGIDRINNHLSITGND